MRIAASVAALVSLGVAAFAGPPVPRKAAEFTIVEPSGKQTLLSSYKGKVVVVAFMSTTCPHCQAYAQVLTKLNKEMGSRGFQPLGVAFNDNAAVRVPGFVQEFGINFPVGFATQEMVLNYLLIPVMDRWVYPQIMVVDRKGMVRAQTPSQGDPNLQDETKLRIFIDSLLKESAGSTSAKASSH